MRRRFVHVITFSLSLISLTSCHDAPELTAPSDAGPSAVHAQWLTADMQNTLDPNGQFFPNEVVGLGRSTISRARAKELALGWARGYASYVRTALERHHGAPISFGELEVAERVFLLDSSYEPFPPEVSNPTHKAWGPYYLVTLEQDGNPAIEVAVSVYADDIIFDGMNRLWYVGDEMTHGNEFRWAGLHLSPSAARRPIITPEKAVAVARAATGANVAAPPRFFRRGPHFYPAFGFWRIALDREVMAKIDGSEWQAVQQVFVDARGWIGIATSDEPAPIPPTLYGRVGSEAQLLPERSENVPAAIAPAIFLPMEGVG